MESTVNNNSTNYITYYIGNPEDLLRSTRIKLFYRKDLTLTISNILETHETISKDPEYNKSGFKGFITRESSDECFEITLPEESELENVFSSIIYYTSSSSTPVGFTNFFRTQSLIIDNRARIKVIKLFTNFNVNNMSLDSEEKSLIINSLVDLRTFIDEDTEISSKLLKDDDKNLFASTGSVLDYYSKTSNLGLNYKRYTSSLTDLISDPSFVLMTDCLSLCGGKTLSKYKFSLSNGIDLNTYDVIYTRFFVGEYNDEISLFEWSDNKETWGTFRIISLVRKNRFGLPKVLVEKYTIPKNIFSEKELNSENLSVESMFSNYIIFKNKDTNEQFLYNIVKRSSLDKISSDFGITCNFWEDSNVQYYSKKKNITSILEIFPKESSLYKDFRALPIKKELYSSLIFEKRVGSWFVLKTTSSDRGYEFLIYSSKYGSVYFDTSEEDNIIPINDKTLLVQTKLNSGGYKFSFYFVKKGLPVYSNKYSEINGLGLEVNNKVEFLSNNSLMSEEEIMEKKLLIDGLRHAPIKSYDFSDSMKFISSYSGILFYTEEINGVQKIFYL